MRERFDKYILRLRKHAVAEQTEHTGRAALEGLLNTFAAEAGKDLRVQHEPRRVAGKGAPDFKVTRSGLILGYVETKGIGEPLDKVLKSEQIRKYRELSQNIVLTDYLHFIRIGKGGIERETLCQPEDLEHPKFRLREDRVAAVGRLLEGFFSTAPDGIGRAKQLALALAKRSRLLRDAIGTELVRQERDHREARLYGLFQIFRDQVFHELTLQEFADALAQMLAYGLFLARLNSGPEQVTLHNAREFVPGSFRLIRELVDFLTELEKDEYVGVRWVVEEVLSIVNALDLRAIGDDLSFRRRKAISRKVRAADADEHRLFERDPFIYFYEDYLKAYDKDTRKARGVYYTPPPVVNFIVRAVDDILKADFGIADGLADHRRVTVLDFACGTGTFLLEIFQRIFDNIDGPDSGRADPIVREHILRNLYGFEYLIAPYTIAHLKLSQYLRDQGHPLHDDERLQVLLANTLERVAPQRNLFLPAVTAEVEAAQTVKDRDILVITGNPPYSGHSKNKGAWITEAINGYKFTVETDERGREIRKPLGERNPKWLNDDYVKFIRFAQIKMDAAEGGIVGVITNHSWLDNPTFRGMRQSLMRSFEQIYVLDLHGNAKKKERAPDGSKDENVFDIEQGVAISLFVKRSGLERGVWRGDLWGARLSKYIALSAVGLDTLDLSEVRSTKPNFYLTLSAGGQAEYERLWGLSDVFVFKTMGVITKRDAITIAFDAESIWKHVTSFAANAIEETRERFRLQPDNDWNAENARADLISSGPDSRHIARISYAPFDKRYTYYTGKTRGFMARPVLETMRHLVDGNVALSLTRKVDIHAAWNHTLVVDGLMTHHAVSMKEGNYVLPLRLSDAPQPSAPVAIGDISASPLVENFSPDFRAFIDARYEHHYTPEEILGYIYSVLHAPAYRERYAEFLRIDFPRVPFPESADNFDAFSALGWALVQAHLLRDLPRLGLGTYHGKGGHTVETVRYAPTEETVWINRDQCFKPVPQAVWDFHIGGYRVLHKYLKSREGRKLSLDEIEHVAAVADSLAFTIDQMARIDEAYRTAFPDRG